MEAANFKFRWRKNYYYCYYYFRKRTGRCSWTRKRTWVHWLYHFYVNTSRLPTKENGWEYMQEMDISKLDYWRKFMREKESVLEHENPLCLLTNWNYSWNDNMKWMVWEEGDFYKGRPYSPRYPLKWTTKLTWDLLLQLIYFMQEMVWYDMNS